tara:strand:- start:240 stop:425 length:186 start_codon:yes stop_codon:yes gene_type:complete
MINKAYETLIIDKHIYRTPNTLSSFVTYFESAELCSGQAKPDTFLRELDWTSQALLDTQKS